MVNTELISNSDEPNELAEVWNNMASEELKGGEKSEEEKNYELKERYLKDSLFETANTRAKCIFNYGEEFTDILKKSNHPQTESIKKCFDGIVGTNRMTGRATLETFFSYVDSMFPPAFSGEERNPKKVEVAEDEYRRAATREGYFTGDSTDALAKVFYANDSSSNDQHIGRNIKNIASDASDYGKAFPSAVIEFTKRLDQPSRSRVTNVQANHEHAVSSSLYNIASTFGNSRTEVGKKMFDPTFSFSGILARENEDYYEGVMNYIKFKVEGSKYSYNDDAPASGNSQPERALPSDIF